MFEDADNYIADIFRVNLPYYLLITLPILIMCSSSPVLGNEFTIQRMSQFDVNGVPYGTCISAVTISRLTYICRAFEARKNTLGSFKSNYICSLVYIRCVEWLSAPV